LRRDGLRPAQSPAFVYLWNQGRADAPGAGEGSSPTTKVSAHRVPPSSNSD